MGNEREGDSPFTSTLNICIQEVQHLVDAARCHSERMQAVSLNYHVFIDVPPLSLPPH